MDKYKNEIIAQLQEKGYELRDPIGTGGFATVYTVLNKQYNQIFCVKLMEIKKEEKEDQQTEISVNASSSLPQSFVAEIGSLVNITHPNVVAIFDYFQSENMLYIILEYCEGGSLDTMIREKTRLEPPLLYSYCRQIIRALMFCHSVGIAHRDIKPLNILIDQHNRPKLADFGLAQKLNKKEELIERFSGSLPYKSPEILNLKPYDPFCADVWALGITFVIMATGGLPWKANSLSDWKKKILKGPGEPPDYVDPSFWEIVCRMLDPNCATRAKLGEIVDNPIFYTNDTLPQLRPSKLNSHNSSHNISVNHLPISNSANGNLHSLSSSTNNLPYSKTVNLHSPIVPSNQTSSMKKIAFGEPLTKAPLPLPVRMSSVVYMKKRRCSKMKKLIQYTFNKD